MDDQDTWPAAVALGIVVYAMRDPVAAQRALARWACEPIASGGAYVPSVARTRTRITAIRKGPIEREVARDDVIPASLWASAEANISWPDGSLDVERWDALGNRERIELRGIRFAKAQLTNALAAAGYDLTRVSDDDTGAVAPRSAVQPIETDPPERGEDNDIASDADEQPKKRPGRAHNKHGDVISDLTIRLLRMSDAEFNSISIPAKKCHPIVAAEYTARGLPAPTGEGLVQITAGILRGVKKGRKSES